MKNTQSAARLWITSATFLTVALTAYAENGTQSSTAKAIVYRVDASSGVVDTPASPTPVANTSSVQSQKPPVAPTANVEAVPAESPKPQATAAPVAKTVVAQNQKPETAPSTVTTNAPAPVPAPAPAPIQKPQAVTAPAAIAAPAPKKATVALAPFKKPAWLTDMSVGFKEGYDDNVYLSDVDKKFLPATVTVPNGSVVARKDQWSWVSTVSAKVGVDFAPVLGNKNLQSASFVYAPDVVKYHNQSAENYDAHRFTTTIKGKADAFSWNFNNSFVYIDGNQFGPVYPGGLYSVFATAVDRERRQQIQDRAAPVIQYDQEKWFVRATASLAYYDLMTTLTNVTGYQNYVDRYDVNGGGDIGYKIKPQLAATFGYRAGHQYQQQFSFSPISSPSDYQRLLLGLEGKPLPWLEVKLQGGPDFRQYAPNTPTHITPVNDKNMVTYYGEALIIAKPTPVDNVTFKYRGFQWVPGCGKVPYFDSSYDLSYGRKLNANLTLDLGARLSTADYNSGNLAPSNNRDDLQYTFNAGLGYAFNPNFSLNGAYSMDLGRNDQPNVANSQTREFDHHVVSLGAKYNF